MGRENQITESVGGEANEGRRRDGEQDTIGEGLNHQRAEGGRASGVGREGREGETSDKEAVEVRPQPISTIPGLTTSPRPHLTPHSPGWKQVDLLITA
ncbi:hypothetical protein E2C01_043759 [Portunus trituberculatus]|uniref:Uncharacterized protein n=1 Tax=Portunus trituberculatus TaxID=210409 RepID=A0A5B7FY68_PORTR|nr:hypothetical protein [Portunus trituberculatus]